jgi:hypothetical protein
MKALGMIVVGFWLCWCGYKLGQNTADEWYTKHAPASCVTYPVKNSEVRHGCLIAGANGSWMIVTPPEGIACDAVEEKVNLIPPIKYKVSQSSAQIEQPKGEQQ